MKAPIPVLGLLLALGLVACGGGDPGASTVEPPNAQVRTAPLKVSGGGSAQFRVEGGDNSIQSYGREASGKDLRQAAVVAHAFFAALAEEDWPGACARMGSRQRSQIARLGAAAKQGPGGCAPTLKQLIGPVSAADGREATVLDAVALRRKGPHAFLIYRGAGGSPFFIAMVGGRGWAVDGLTPTPLG
jgi:hypothetical protein